MAQPRVHLGLALLALAGLRRVFTRSEQVAFLSSSVLVDADHLVDYVARRWPPTSGLLVLPLHGWEYALALIVAGAGSPARRLLAAAGLGLAYHLLVDQVTNRPAHRLLYSILFRARHGFRGDALAFRQGDARWMNQPWWQWL